MNHTDSKSGAGEDHMSMFFDFGSVTNPDLQSSHSDQGGGKSSSDISESQDSAPRAGGIRVSLACIPVSRLLSRGELEYLPRESLN